jgi:hypothetical protein
LIGRSFGSWEGKIVILQLPRGVLLHQLTHDWPFRSIAFSPDGKLLAAGTLDGRIKLWDVATGEERRILWTGAIRPVDALVFSPDGKWLASSTCVREDPKADCEQPAVGQIQLWELATGALRQTISAHWGAIWALAFSPNGRLLASAGEDALVHVWEIKTGSRVFSIKNGIWGVPFHAIAFSPDGQLLATDYCLKYRPGSCDQPEVRLWNGATGDLVRILSGLTGYNSIVHTISFSPDGKLLAAGMFQDIKIWKASSGAELRTISAKVVGSVAFIPPDGRWLAYTDFEYPQDTIKLQHVGDLINKGEPMPEKVPKEWRVPGDFPTIQAAIDAASDGDTIRVLDPGIYRESLTITKSLKIIANWEAFPVIIQPKEIIIIENVPTIFIDGERPIEVTLENLLVRHIWGEQTVIRVIGQARLTLERVQVFGGVIGLLASGQLAIVRDSQIYGNSYGLVAYGSGQVIIENSAIFDNSLIGLEAGGEVQLLVRNSDIYRSKPDDFRLFRKLGISSEDTARIVIENSRIYKHDVGVAVFESATVEMFHSTSAYNEEMGVWLSDRANLTMRENIIHHNAWGVAAWLRKCGFEKDRYQGGTLDIGETNVIVKNSQGNVCLP